MGFELDGFVRSLAGQSPATRRAYEGDVVGFLEWLERAGIDDPGSVDRLLLRRYLAFLATRRYARRTIARKASALRCYFAWLRRTGVISSDPSRRLSAPAGEARLPRVLSSSELDEMLDGARAVDDAHFDALYDAYLGDATVRDFIETANPAALGEISRRFADSIVTVGRGYKLVLTSDGLTKRELTIAQRDEVLIAELGLSPEVVSMIPPDIEGGTAPF